MFIGISPLWLGKSQKPGAPPFDPTTVAALQGTYDASVLTSLKQSSVTGGAVTAAGQVVGEWDSTKAAGAALTAADAARFLLGNAGSLWYLDDTAQLLSCSAGGGSTTAFYFGAAVKLTNPFALNTLYSEETALNGLTGYDLTYSNTTDKYTFSSGNGTVRTSVVCNDVVGGTTNPHVITCWDDGTNLNVQLNGGTIFTAARAVVSAGTLTPSIGCVAGNAANNGFYGFKYALCWAKNGVPSLSDRNSLRTWLGQKCGLTL